MICPRQIVAALLVVGFSFTGCLHGQDYTKNTDFDPWQPGRRVVIKNQLSVPVAEEELMDFTPGTPGSIVSVENDHLVVRVFDQIFRIHKSDVLNEAEVQVRRDEWFNEQGRFIGVHDPIGLSYAISCGFVRPTDRYGLRRLAPFELDLLNFVDQGQITLEQSGLLNPPELTTQRATSSANPQFTTEQKQLELFLDAVALESRKSNPRDRFLPRSYIPHNDSITELGKSAYLRVFTDSEDAIRQVNQLVTKNPNHPAALNWRILVHCVAAVQTNAIDPEENMRLIQGDISQLEKRQSISSVPYLALAVVEASQAKRRLKELDFSDDGEDSRFLRHVKSARELCGKAKLLDVQDPIRTEIELFTSITELGYQSLRDQKRLKTIPREISLQARNATIEQPWCAGFLIVSLWPSESSGNLGEDPIESSGNAHDYANTFLAASNETAAQLRIPGCPSTKDRGATEWCFGPDPLSCLIPRACGMFLVMPTANDPLRFSVEISLDELQFGLDSGEIKEPALAKQIELLEIDLNFVMGGRHYFYDLLSIQKGVNLFQKISTSNLEQSQSELNFDWSQPPTGHALAMERESLEMGQRNREGLERTARSSSPSATQARELLETLDKQANEPLSKLKPNTLGERKLVFGNHLDRLNLFKLGYKPSPDFSAALVKQFGIDIDNSVDGNSDGQPNWIAVWTPLVILEHRKAIENSYSRFKESMMQVVELPDQAHYAGFEQFELIMDKLRIGGTPIYVDSLERQLEYLILKGYDLNPATLVEERKQSLINSRESHFQNTLGHIQAARNLLVIFDSVQLEDLLSYARTIHSELQQASGDVRKNLVQAR